MHPKYLPFSLSLPLSLLGDAALQGRGAQRHYELLAFFLELQGSACWSPLWAWAAPLALAGQAVLAADQLDSGQGYRTPLCLRCLIYKSLL